MVYRTVRFRCNKCRKGYSSYDAAWGCELSHITDAVIADFRADLKRILHPDEPETSEGRALSGQSGEALGQHD